MRVRLPRNHPPIVRIINQQMDLKNIAAVVADWADQYPLVGVAYIFGSRVRGDYKAKSDLDVAIEFGLR